MNVAISCDSLLERNHANEIVEMICEAFPDSMIYCLVHREKAILGTIEQRRIVSTGLSRKVVTENDLYRYLPMLPSLVQQMAPSCQHNLLINISRGFSHGFKKCDKTKQITYLYELSFQKHFDKWWKKLFRAFITNKFINALKQVDLLLVSNETLQKDLEKLGIKSTVLVPPFRLSDYALFPKSMFKHDFYTVDTRGLTLAEVDQLKEFFINRQVRFQFVGPDLHLETLKKDGPENRFFGERCSGEHAPVLASSRAFISFDTVMFPKMPLAAMAVGRPIVVLETQKESLSGTGVHYLKGFNLKELGSILDQIDQGHDDFDGQKIRANVMKYHDIKFKAALKRILDKELGLSNEPLNADQLISTTL